MNKQQRKLKGIAKFKKRLRNYGIDPKGNHIYKTTGKPCSCVICSPGKVQEKAKYRLRIDHTPLKAI